MVATNEIPRLPDASGAIASRFYILRTPNSWFGKEDHNLTARLTEELPAILRWSPRAGSASANRTCSSLERRGSAVPARA